MLLIMILLLILRSRLPSFATPRSEIGNRVSGAAAESGGCLVFVFIRNRARA